MGAYKEPHGGELKNLYLNETETEQEKKQGRDYKSWDLTERQVCDIELLLNGAFSPLEGFLTEAEYNGVIKDMHLPDGILWPMPITPDVTEERAEYMPIDDTTDDQTVLNISGTEFRRRLQQGLDIPEWFSYPKVIEELRKSYPPRHKQGVTVFFTGLSGSGKSTIANTLLVKLLEMGDRPVTLLDGDHVRKNLSSELGFSKEHRDRKGLYAKARAGIIKEFTGISDPYEAPENPEVYIDTADLSPDLAAHRIIVKLESMGFIR